MALNWLRQTTYSVVATRARVFPEQLALLLVEADGDELVPVSYTELHSGIEAAARRLWGAGVRSGMPVAIWADNSLAWIQYWLASSLVGAVTVAVNPRLTPRETAGLLAATDVTHLLAGGRTVAGAAELAVTQQAAAAAYGIEYATEQCASLLEFGVPGLHFYTLNKARSTVQIVRNLSLPVA